MCKRGLRPPCVCVWLLLKVSSRSGRGLEQAWRPVPPNRQRQRRRTRGRGQERGRKQRSRPGSRAPGGWQAPARRLGRRHKVPRTGVKKEIYCPTVWEPEVQDQGVGRATLPLKVTGRGPSQASLLVSGHSVAGGNAAPSLRGVLPCTCLFVSKFPFS